MTFQARLLMLGLSLAMILSMTPSITAAQAQTMPTSYQKAQMRFLESYGSMPNGLKPTPGQAWSVVQTYPTVPTNSALANLVSDAPLQTKVADTEQAPIPCAPTYTAPKPPWYPYDIDFKWGRGWPEELFWICQNMSFDCNVNTGVIKQASTWGDDGITAFGSVLWHYVGYDTTDGMPKWIYTANTATVLFKQTFGWGYGPISGQYDFDMYITDTCVTGKHGGPIAVGGYTS